MCIKCRCTALNWPIRKQILVFFIITTFITQAALYLTLKLFVLNFINSESSDAITGTVYNRTQSNMNVISEERGNLLVAHQDVIGNFVFILLNIIYEAYNSQIYPLDPGKFNIPSYNYDELLCLHSEDFEDIAKTKEKYGENKISFAHSSLFKEKDSKDSAEGNDFIEKTSILDRFFPTLMMNPYFISSIFRVNIIFINIETNTKIMRTYPAQKITNESYKLTGSNTDFEYYYEYGTSLLPIKLNKDITELKKFPFYIMNGPYKDIKTNLSNIISMNCYLYLGDSFRGVVQVEVSTTGVDIILEKMRFLETGQPIAFNIYGNMIYNPKYWLGLLDHDNPYLKVYNITNISGIDHNYFKKTLYGIVSSSGPEPNILREIQAVRMNTISNETVDQYQSISLLPKNSWTNQWLFCIAFIVEKAEIVEIQNKLLKTILRQNQAAEFLVLILCMATLALVIISCYKIAMRIAKPLKKMIQIAEVINNNATEKLDLAMIKFPEGENQIGHLVRAFKNLLGTVTSKRNNITHITQKKIEYPFNQYNQEFISKAGKGSSDVDWHNIIEEIQNDFEEDFTLDT